MRCGRKCLTDYQQTTAECIKDRADRLGSSQLLDKVTCNEVLLLGTRVAISDSARDLGIIIDRELSLEANVTAVCRASYNQLRQLRSVVRSLSVHATKTLVQAFISCRLDYCNSLLYGINDGLLRRLQSVQKQNAAARLVTGAGRRDHITPVLRRLHWLPASPSVSGIQGSRTRSPVTGWSRACVPHRRLPSTV